MNNLSRNTFYIQTITDLVALVASFVIAFCIKNVIPSGNLDLPLYTYQRLLFVVIISYLIIDFTVLISENFLLKDTIKELKSTAKTVGGCILILVLYTFFTKTGSDYSRVFIAIFAILFFILCLSLRILLREKVLPLLKNSRNAERIIVVGSKENIQSVVNELYNSNDWRFNIVGAVVTDSDEMGSDIDDIPVISNNLRIITDVSNSEADALFIIPDNFNTNISHQIKALSSTGKSIYIKTMEYSVLPEYNRTIDRLGDFDVISFKPIIQMPKRDVFIKRFFDILFSLLLLPVYALFWLLTAIFNNIESRGPVQLEKIRVGKNGRRYFQYRFRVFRMDAEEREKNNENPFTKWGMFLYKTHLDGFPVIINILSSDMSFIGPKSPTFSDFLNYEPKRRKILSIKPGALGYWNCTKKDTSSYERELNYIQHWNILKDIGIFFESFIRYITFQSTRKYNNILNKTESYFLLSEYKKFKQPYVYDRSAYIHKVTASEKIYLFLKRAIDIIASCIGIVVLSPLFLILIILIIADDGGGPFYGHERIGLKGKRIKIYKFRSMRQDAGDLNKILTPEQLEQYYNEFKIDNDPRITKIGNFLRKTSLDELPQLFNILGGSLSIIGPRPIIETEIEMYKDDIAKLLSVKPGLTGYWQAYARNNATYESGQRQKMEMYYIDHKGIILDIKIFFKTIISVIKKEGVQ